MRESRNGCGNDNENMNTNKCELRENSESTGLCDTCADDHFIEPAAWVILIVLSVILAPIFLISMAVDRWIWRRKQSATNPSKRFTGEIVALSPSDEEPYL